MAPCPLHDGGISNALLGTAENPLPSSSALDGPTWVGVSIDGTPEMRPLSLLSATALALNVADNAATAAKLADGAVTAIPVIVYRSHIRWRLTELRANSPGLLRESLSQIIPCASKESSSSEPP